MAYEVDRLEIVIETATSKTSKALDVLISKLKSISSEIQKMSNFVNQVEKLDKKLLKSASSKKGALGGNVAEGSEEGFKKLEEQLHKLDPEYLKIIERIKQTKQYMDLMVNNPNLDSDQLLEVLFKRNSELGKSLNLEKQLVQETERLNKLKNDKLKDDFKKLQSEIVMSTDKVQKLLEELKKTDEFRNIKSLNPDFTDAQIVDTLRMQNAEVSKLNGLLGKTKRGAGNLRKAFLKVTSAIYLIRKSFQLVSQAIAHEKVTKQFRAVFAKLGRDSGEAFQGELLGRAEEFIKNYSSALSLSKSELMDYMSTFAQMTSAMGLASETVYMMSESLTMLGGDMGSFFSRVESTEDAMIKLRAGLSGQIRPMRMLGIDITKTTLSMIAHNHGITDSLETMSAASKTQLRYLAIIEQMQVAMGDASKSVNNSANQMNMFKAQVKELGIALGQLLMPVFKQLLTYSTAVVMALKDIVYNIAALVGYKMPDFDIDGDAIIDAEDDVDDLDESIKNLQATLGGFDELNILSSGNEMDNFDTGYSELDDAIVKAYEEYTAMIAKNLEDITNRAKKISDEIKPIIENLLKMGAIVLGFASVIGIISKIVNAVTTLSKSVNILGIAFKAVFGNPIVLLIAAIAAAVVYLFETNEVFKQGVLDLFDTLKPLLAVIINLVMTIVEGLKPLVPMLDQVLQLIGTTIGSVITSLAPILSLLVNSISAVVAVLTYSLGPAIENIMITIQFLVDIISSVLTGLTSLLRGFVEFLAGVFTLDMDRAWKGIEQIINAFAQFAVDIFKSLKNLFVGIWDNMSEVFGSTIDWIWNKLVSFWDKVKNLFSKAKDVFAIPFNVVKDMIEDILDADNFKEVFIAVVNTMIKGMNIALSAPFKALNGVLGKIKDLNILGAKPFSFIPTIPVPQIPMLASGGIVDQGQMFIAREAGAELVGGFGGKTGVMNNDQIVESVSRGVAAAVSEVMSNSLGNNGTQNINVYLDGNQITNAVEENKIRRGVVTLSGGKI